eukprot:3471264-Rhodomonas_salina.2
MSSPHAGSSDLGYPYCTDVQPQSLCAQAHRSTELPSYGGTRYRLYDPTRRLLLSPRSRTCSHGPVTAP